MSPIGCAFVIVVSVILWILIIAIGLTLADVANRIIAG